MEVGDKEESENPFFVRALVANLILVHSDLYFLREGGEISLA